MSNFLMMLAGLFTNTCHEANQGFKDSRGAGSSVSQPCKNENVLQSSHGSSAQLYQAKAKVDVKQRVEGLDKVYKATGMTHRIHAGEIVIWMRYPTPDGVARALDFMGIVDESVQLFEI